MTIVQGHYEAGFDHVRDVFQERIAAGEELGASLCVNIDGKNVIDLWGGYADAEKTKPWNEDTLTVVWSCTKIVTALAAAILIDRGLLDPEEKVSKYWPEFGAAGKEDITVAHILSHTSGLPAWEQPITIEETYSTKSAADKLARQSPWWTPGEHSGYQLFNHGHFVGELVRRITGKTLKQFISDEIAVPLGADFRLGLEEKDYPRTADVIPPPAIPLDALDPNSILVRAISAPLVKAEYSSTREFRDTEIGAVNGFGNARSLCCIGSIVSLAGTVDGKQYISPQTVDQMIRERISGPDQVLGSFLRFGLGVGLPVLETVPWVPEGRICFWCGWGGSTIVMDLDRRMTISYTMNKMEAGALGNENTAAYVNAVYAAVAGNLPS
ncbi:hypothetical protein O988_05129 [Pseudogymnoascus sp. VKM F-3808]|nr:hypothetical protein O988_05129 [Pseudogymnoascus sp. VKM F-3808]